MVSCPRHEHGRPDAFVVANFNTLRPIYIDREENDLLSKIFNNSSSTEMMMRVGSLIFRSIGQILPEQLKSFHTEEHIFPVGYRITRLFWSAVVVNDFARYDCFISDFISDGDAALLSEPDERRGAVRKDGDF